MLQTLLLLHALASPPAAWTDGGRCDGECCFDRAVGPHMVLQRDSSSTRVWGTAVNGTAIRIQLAGPGGAREPAIATAADATGKWWLDLPAHPGSVVDEYSLTLTCGGGGGGGGGRGQPGGSVTATGILFGDVFGCHGQSNMAFGLGQDFNSSTECATAHLHPHLRVFAHSAHQDWALPSNASVCEGSFCSPFSAVCWYFGRNMAAKLGGKVPVGLVGSMVGGTPVESWSGPDALAQCDQTQVTDRVGSYWSTFIETLLPMQMSGWLWYQGENNVGGVAAGVRSGCCSIGCPNTTGQNACQHPCEASGQRCADYYACQYPAMVNDWRRKWNGGSNLSSIAGRPAGPRPMIAVELAPYMDGASDFGFPNVAMLREAQRKADAALAASALTPATDWGDIADPFGNIHPEWKSPVGARLADAMHALAYGGTAAPHRSPTATVATAVPATAAGFDVVVRFDAAVTMTPPVVGGEIGVPGIVPSAATGGCQIAADSRFEPQQMGQCMWFDVDGRNITSGIKVDAGGLSITVPLGAAAPPKQIKYGWGSWPVAMLWGVDGGLPASAFFLNVAAP